MTKHGDKLSSLTVDEITERLNEESDGKAIKRLVAAREYLDGSSPADISDKFGWPEQTIYSWFDRLESNEIDEALYDESPPGRPGALTEEEFEMFKQAVSNPPKEAGFDAPAWSSALAQEFLRDEFDQDFSRRHVRRLLKRAGLSWQTPRPQPPTADEEEREEFRKDLKKTD
ncbi:MAG: IS630 family transposase [Halorhabdus sp.]